MDDFGKVCVEVCELLSLLDDTYVKRIPEKLIAFLNENKDESYHKTIKPEEPLEKQNLLQETIDLLALIKLTYWCKDDKERNDFQEMLYLNEKKYKQELREKYNPDEIFKKNISKEQSKKDMQLIEYRQESFLERIFIKIKEFLKLQK